MTEIDFLLSRRSANIRSLGTPGPDATQLNTILTAAARVPDHKMLCPWWFVVFEGESRKKIGSVLRNAYAKIDPEAADVKRNLEAEKFLRAPTVIAVISRIKEGKAPQWEQFLSAGAACHNLCLAANALGFGTNWVSGWPSVHDDVRAAMKLDDRDNIAGFIYIGTTSEKAEDRARPNLSDIVSHWSEDYTPNKGDVYGKSGTGIPEAGFKTEKS